MFPLIELNSEVTHSSLYSSPPEIAPHDDVPIIVNEEFYYYSVTKKKSCLAQKGHQHNVVVGDVQNNLTFADFPYHIRMAEFLVPMLQIIFHLS